MSKAGYGAKVEVESKECKIWRIWAILVKFFLKTNFSKVDCAAKYVVAGHDSWLTRVAQSSLNNFTRHECQVSTCRNAVKVKSNVGKQINIYARKVLE